MKSPLALLLLPAFLLGPALTGRAATANSSTANIFSGASADASTTHSGGFDASHVTDGLAAANANEFVFDDAPQSGTPQLLSVYGFDATAGIDSITFFDTNNFGQRVETEVSIYTSTSVLTNDLTLADYTPLNGGAFFTLPTGGGTPPSYFTEGTDAAGSGRDFDTLTGLNIPVGTKSILFDFGNGTGEGPGLSEVQGFAAVPEPGTWALLVGCVGLLALAYRRRAGLLS